MGNGTFAPKTTENTCTFFPLMVFSGKIAQAGRSFPHKTKGRFLHKKTKKAGILAMQVPQLSQISPRFHLNFIWNVFF